MVLLCKDMKLTKIMQKIFNHDTEVTNNIASKTTL
jgi:hypothetical protein